MTDGYDTSTERCPVCKSKPGEATASTAPNQAVCPTPFDECPIVSWRTDAPDPTGPAGSAFGYGVVD